MIFGTTAPRMIYKHGIQGQEAIVNLDHAVLTQVEPTTEYVEHVSEIDLDREFIWRNDSWAVRILIHLFKYADPAAKYAEIVSHKGHDLSLYLHRDGHPFARSVVWGVITDALFFLKEITPFFCETAEYRDGLVLEFESVSPGANYLTPVRRYVRWLDKNGKPILDKNGKEIWVML